MASASNAKGILEVGLYNANNAVMAVATGETTFAFGCGIMNNNVITCILAVTGPTENYTSLFLGSVRWE